MSKVLSNILALSVILCIGAGGMAYYYHIYLPRQREHRQLQTIERQEKIIERLSSDRRLAEVIVTDQKVVDGKTFTTLLFQEYAKAGEPLPPQSFTIEGDQAHIDAWVVKFDDEFVYEKHNLKGHSIALFTRLFGDRQTPESAFHIDQPGRIPLIYAGAEPSVREFEEGLWREFWKLVHDESARKGRGVRMLGGESVFGQFQRGFIYKLTIRPAGGVSMTAVPVPDVFRQALTQE